MIIIWKTIKINNLSSAEIADILRQGILEMKLILVLSHCILNNASKVETDEAELAAEYKVRDELMELVGQKRVQLIQLPCPEFILYGSRRWGHVRDQFDNPFFRRECRRLTEPIILQLEEYSSRKDSFAVLGIVSVEGSPSCGHRLTCTGENWRGELGSDAARIAEIQKSLEMKNEPGVFMGIIEEAVEEAGLEIPILTMNEAVQLLNQLE